MKDLLEHNAPLRAKHIYLPLTEDASGKRQRVRGPAQKIGEKNQNNRVYPESVWRKNLSESSPFMQRMKRRLTLGELEHPESGNTRLEHVSHLIEKAWIQTLDGQEAAKYEVTPGRYVMTESLILKTPKGQILRELFDVGVPVGISSRGRGNVETVDGVDIVQDDYELSTWDYVENPSVKEAHHIPLKEEGPTAPPPPDAVKQNDGTIPPPVAPEEEKPEGLPPDFIKTAEELVRAMKDIIVDDDADPVEVAELLVQSLDVLDQLGSSSTAPDAKIRGEIISLSHVLARKIGGKKSDSDKPKEPTGSEDPKEPKEPKEPAQDDEPDEKKEESVIYEGTFDDLVDSYLKERQATEGPVYRGELENILNRAGHKVDQNVIGELALAMRRKGFEVKENEYGNPPKQEGRYVMPADVKEIVAALAEENSKLKKKLEQFKESVPKEKYEAAVKLSKGLVEKGRELKRSLDEMTKRYNVAVQLAEGLATRAKKMRVDSAISEHISKNPSLAPFRGILAECTSAQEVTQKAKQIAEAAKRNGTRRADLPPIGESASTLLQESVEEPCENSDPLISGIAKRGC